MNLARIAIAGPVAEVIYSDEQYEPRIIKEWASDWAAARQAVRNASPRPIDDQSCDLVLGEVFSRLLGLFSTDAVWDRVAMVAEHLEAHEWLEQDQLDELREEGLFDRPAM